MRVGMAVEDSSAGRTLRPAESGSEHAPRPPAEGLIRDQRASLDTPARSEATGAGRLAGGAAVDHDDVVLRVDVFVIQSSAELVHASAAPSISSASLVEPRQA